MDNIQSNLDRELNELFVSTGMETAVGNKLKSKFNTVEAITSINYQILQFAAFVIVLNEIKNQQLTYLRLEIPVGKNQY